jgi:hypothetical protein
MCSNLLHDAKRRCHLGRFSALFLGNVWDSSSLTPAVLIEVFSWLFSLPPGKSHGNGLSGTTDSSLQILFLSRRFELTCCFYLMTFKSIMIYLLTAIGLIPGGSSTVHIYTQTVHRTTKKNNT